MGMFDSFYTADGVEWQTKAYECVLAEWGVGDSVPDGECVRTYQVKVLGGGHTRGTARQSFVTIRDLVVAGIDVPRDSSLPLVDYCGGVAEMPTPTETRTEWRVAYEWLAPLDVWLPQHTARLDNEAHADDRADFLATQGDMRNVRVQQRTVTEWVDA